ncbi:MAG TPA: hypothetical protein VLX92_30895 [Kofleriaceae bacterium]|nr:hypothetical protein [Kofleriaceae bacterium]
MTEKRDLKRRIRERMAHTGEAYTAARRHVLDARPQGAIAVIDVLDLTEHGARLGLTCRIGMFPQLAAEVDPVAVVERLRGVLVATAGDPAIELWHAAVLRGERPPRPRLDVVAVRRFSRRVLAGLGGVSADGTLLGMHVPGARGVVPVLAVLALHARSLAAQLPPRVVLRAPDPTGDGMWGVW